MRILSLTALACFLSLTLGAQGPATAEEEAVSPVETIEKPLDFWMQKKLDYSAGILKGLSLADYSLIVTNAQQMRRLNKIEGFVRSRNKDYRTHLHTFESVTTEIIREAEKKNIEGVTLAFHQLTTSCVRCHQTLREPIDKPTPADLKEIH